MSGKGAYSDVPGDTGRNLWREPLEFGEGLYIVRRPFWANEAEELRWLWAVEECRELKPPMGYAPAGRDTLKYLERVAMVLGEKFGGAKSFPEVRLPYSEAE